MREVWSYLHYEVELLNIYWEIILAVEAWEILMENMASRVTNYSVIPAPHLGLSTLISGSEVVDSIFSLGFPIFRIILLKDWETMSNQILFCFPYTSLPKTVTFERLKSSTKLILKHLPLPLTLRK